MADFVDFRAAIFLHWRRFKLSVERAGCSRGSPYWAAEDRGMPTGTIARLLIDKGFGFIRDEGGIEHFFHRSSVRGAVFELLREGQRVEFTPEESGKGPRAGEVRLIES
jgi:CspA family cold shock protein